MSSEIDILYYSATGNTETVITEILQVLQNNKIKVQKFSLCQKYDHLEGRDLLLAFPINSQAVSPFIWKALKALPEGKGENVYVVLTMNESASILGPLYKLLQKKGFNPVGCSEISMPNNLLLGPYDDTLSRLPSAKEQARQFANQIVTHTTQWKETKKGSSFVSFLSRETSLPWVTMRLVNKLVVDKNKCTKCGQCIKDCPVSNIKMAEFPKHLGNCQFCMHCGANCPKHAITLKNKPQCYIRKTK